MKGVMIFILALVLLIGLWFGYLFLLRPAYDLKREAVQSSQQYVEAKQSLLMQLASEYHTAEEEAHKEYIIERIKLEAERIPYDQLPESIKTILRSEQ